MIVEKLNQAYALRAQAEGREPWRPRPSALGGCLREMAWLVSGAEREPRTPESTRLLELGTQRGEALERMARASWPDAGVQVPVQVPTPWGSMPGTVDLWIPSLRTIVDFKTAGAYSMGLVVSGEKEDEGYALQLNAYRHGIANGGAWPLPTYVSGPETEGHKFIDLSKIRTILVYEAKDSDARKGVTAGMLHEVEVPYTAALEEAYQKRLEEIRTILESQRSGTLNPLDVQGMPRDSKGKEHWRCRLSKENKPLYCSIGSIRGQCG